MADRQQLEAWIAATERTRRRLRTALIPAGLVALALLLWSRPAGGLGLTIVAIVAMFGNWITTSHITDWSARIVELEHPKPRGAVLRRERD
jgi:uncharacterized membrane protein YhhN